jgi:flagellar basal-body rod protein FlgC
MAMNDFAALDLASAGMSVQRQRLQIVAENLANQDTTGPNGPYRRKQAVIESQAVSFDQELTSALSAEADAVKSVAVAGVAVDSTPPTRVYDPGHPNADAQGYVLKSNISPAREMADMIEASDAYQANLTTAMTTQNMLNASLNLLGS